MTTAIPSTFSKKEWDRYVRLGRKLVKKMSGLQFDLGDLMIEMLHERPHGHGEVTEIIESFAHAIGLAPGTLRKYYEVARQWPKAKRRADVSFSVHAELAYTRSRYAKIRKDPLDPFTHERHWTVNEAIRAADRMPHTPTNKEERLAKTRSLLRSDEDAADAVREMLGRPDVRSRVASDHRTRNLMRQAQYEHWDQVEEAVDADEELALEVEEEPEDLSPVVSYDEGPLEILRLLGNFAAFFVSLQKTIPEIHAQDYSEETKEAVLENITKARSFLDWCESAITTGKTDMDKALARLLEDEEGE
ncbi:DUF6192 family protein [Streptomyces sp. NPDC020412]|uniref:DUF6192 family protein n=1 Tax=Streptomyces sp. NPDC020412 TaxID=3365073 RepID=UPI0037A4E523